MAIEVPTKVSIGDLYNKKVANLTLEDAKFFGRPNFSGEPDQFKDARRKFTVLIPNEVADQLRDLGWNVKTNEPTAEILAEFPDRERLSFLKVMVDDNSIVQIRVNDVPETLPVAQFSVIDRSRIQYMDMEIRAWQYNDEEVKAGLEEPKYSARLVAIVATIQFNALEAKYGRLG